MASNAMKISQLVARLQALQAIHGELDCALSLSQEGEVYAVDGLNVNVAVQLPWKTLPQPVLMFGLAMNVSGTVYTRSPGNVYQVTANDDGWNHNRFDAPLNEDVDIWRRGDVGADVGRRVGDDLWLVYNKSFGASDEHLVECVPAAILGWKPRG